MLKRFVVSSLLLNTVYMVAGAPGATPETFQTPTVPRYENNVFLYADFLYWYSKQEGNDYATTGSAITVPGTIDPNTGLTPGQINSGHVYSPHSKTKPGLKVGLGINLSHDRWELFTEYTYAYGKAEGSVASNNLNAGILPLFSYTPHNSILANTTYAASSGATGFVSNASSNWRLYFNNINLELARTIGVSSYCSLHPHFGLQGSWQHQHLNATYIVASTTNSSAVLGNNQLHYIQKFWGVGLRAGLDGTLQCCKHFGIFGDTALSALWSHFDAKALSYDTNGIAGYSNVLVANQVNSFYTLSPVIQILIGLQSDWAIYDKYQLLFQAGWEEQIWFFQNQHSSVIADTSLFLQGLTVSAKFVF